MRLFQYIVPLYDNAGKPHDLAKLKDFEGALIGAANGYTKGPRQFGVWFDGVGKEYHDESVAYTVALGDNADHVGDMTRRVEAIDTAFFSIFGDQKALFRSEIGTAAIINRPD